MAGCIRAFGVNELGELGFRGGAFPERDLSGVLGEGTLGDSVRPMAGLFFALEIPHGFRRLLGIERAL